MARRINNIVIHCTAGYGDVAAIKRFWKESLGWKQVGYHRFIYEDGRIEELAPFEVVTNGVGGHNSDSIHISYQGGVDRKNVRKALDTRTLAQKESILTCIGDALRWIKEQGQPVDLIRIVGHRDFSPDKDGSGVIESWERIKECPCFDAIPEYRWITVLSDNQHNPLLPTAKR